MIRMLPSLAALVILAGCTSVPATHSESTAAPDADFSVYRTFSWVETTGYGAGSSSDPLRLLDRNIRAAISAELGKRGYTESAEDPDLRFAYESVSYEKTKSNPFRIGIGMGSWGGNIGGSVGVGTPSVESYEEGRLVIRAIDPESNAEVWLGTVTGRRSGSTNESDVARLVAMTLQDFPARSP